MGKQQGNSSCDHFVTFVRKRTAAMFLINNKRQLLMTLFSLPSGLFPVHSRDVLEPKNQTILLNHLVQRWGKAVCWTSRGQFFFYKRVCYQFLGLENFSNSTWFTCFFCRSCLVQCISTACFVLDCFYLPFRASGPLTSCATHATIPWGLILPIFRYLEVNLSHRGC